MKKVAIRPFENKSTEFELGDIVYNGLVKEFQEDGRLKLVTQQPDCVIEGTILKWEEDVYSYDSWNNVQDYMLRLTCSVVFTDLINNQIIY
ncbi:MAG TPA: LptE family protein, partial [Candidatus Syntrophosphaera thermopropionivorans]|nr:LptE family protein [Candidatus Syntrophosphaera thermopropionivorans]